jgi:hypothetical protein
VSDETTVTQEPNKTDHKDMPILLTRHESSPLLATDRCDRCGAQAYASATIKETVLLFCGHHFRKYLDALCIQADSVDDYTAELDNTGMTSAIV